jgi:exopolysaccharide biosynthesis protein
VNLPNYFEDEDEDDDEYDFEDRTLQTLPRRWLRLEDPAVPSRNRQLQTVNRKLQTLIAFLCFLPASLFAEWHVLDRQPSEPGDGVPFKVKVTDGAATANLLLVVFHPNTFALRVVSNDEGRYGSVSDAATATDAVAGVNGGYFQPDKTPVGLLISDNQTVHKFETAKLLSGVFFVRDGKPGLVRSSRFARMKNVSQAIQCGPFLLEEGRALTGLNNERSAPRTFVFAAGNSVWGFGICRSVTLAEMGQILSVPDLLGRAPVVSALNLDGGSSTQFWARSGDAAINSSSLAVVANYLLLVHRAK